METGSNPPGHLFVEVIATDRLGESSSERFWVDVPETPPLAPGTPVPPRFSQIAQFREKYGLEKVFPVADETELNERIFDLITAWWNPHTPSGEVARASYDRWGVPLRPVDVAEMEYREWYVAVNTPLIEAWGVENHPATYAGNYVDHAAGGVMHIGFTESQADVLEDLIQEAPLVATDRLSTFPSTPTASAAGLASKKAQIVTALEGNEPLRTLVNETRVDYVSNVVRVGTLAVAATSQSLGEALGSLNQVSVVYQPALPEPAAGRNRNSGRMLAGHRIVKKPKGGCTAAFGAYEVRENKQTKEKGPKPFLLTAGHCYHPGQKIWRSPDDGNDDWKEVGVVTRNPYHEGSREIDAAAARLTGTGIAPRWIYGRQGKPWPINGVSRGFENQSVCYSGATNGVRCGTIVAHENVEYDDHAWPLGLYVVEHDWPVPDGHGGDSGSPVWDRRTQKAIGILSGGRENDHFLFQPLLNTPDDVYVGALNASHMYDLTIMTSD